MPLNAEQKEFILKEARKLESSILLFDLNYFSSSLVESDAYEHIVLCWLEMSKCIKSLEKIFLEDVD